MSPFGHISTIHRATFTVPDDVYDRFGHTEEYERFTHVATLGMDTSVVSGSNNYAHEEQWLESLRRQDCEEFINRWHNRILRWQETMRSC